MDVLLVFGANAIVGAIFAIVMLVDRLCRGALEKRGGIYSFRIIVAYMIVTVVTLAGLQVAVLMILPLNITDVSLPKMSVGISGAAAGHLCVLFISLFFDRSIERLLVVGK